MSLRKWPLKTRGAVGHRGVSPGEPRSKPGVPKGHRLFSATASFGEGQSKDDLLAVNDLNMLCLHLEKLSGAEAEKKRNDVAEAHTGPAKIAAPFAAVHCNPIGIEL